MRSFHSLDVGCSLFPFRRFWPPGCCLPLCLAVFLTGFVLPALAQPETFEGNPDSSAFIPIPKDTDDWTRHFRLGALVGLNISANFNESAAAFNSLGGAPQNGIFGDGYVRTDQTGNAGGYTGYWGYNNASQYNAAAQTLTMHSINSFSTTSGVNSSENGGFMPGLEAAYGGNLWYWKHARVGWEAGLGWLPISLTANSAFSGTASQVSYVYNVGNVVLPSAPYQGGPSGQGEPLIPSTPESQTATNLEVSGTSQNTLDVSLYTLRFGPTLYWDLTQHFSTSIGVGPALGVVSGDYKYTDTIMTGGFPTRTSGQINATDVVFGGYVNATLLYHTSESADIYIGAQYMPMTDATISGNGRSCQLNLSGQLYFSVGINWAF